MGTGTNPWNQSLDSKRFRAWDIKNRWTQQRRAQESPRFACRGHETQKVGMVGRVRKEILGATWEAIKWKRLSCREGAWEGSIETFRLVWTSWVAVWKWTKKVERNCLLGLGSCWADAKSWEWSFERRHETRSASCTKRGVISPAGRWQTNWECDTQALSWNKIA